MQGEFRGDVTRDTFYGFKHFSRVLMQQGRVHLDADWNEQTSILLRYLQALAADLIGPHGGPDPDGAFSSFKITMDAAVPNDFIIGSGHYYVDGILCELASTPVPIEIDNSNNVKLAAWRVDRYDFVEGHYVQVSASNPVSPNNPADVIAKITAIAERTLSLGNVPLGAFPNTTLPVLRRITTYRTQPDLPIPLAQNLTAGLAYLDV